jgi:hypothetical protein
MVMPTRRLRASTKSAGEILSSANATIDGLNKLSLAADATGFPSLRQMGDTQNVPAERAIYAGWPKLPSRPMVICGEGARRGIRAIKADNHVAIGGEPPASRWLFNGRYLAAAAAWPSGSTAGLALAKSRICVPPSACRFAPIRRTGEACGPMRRAYPWGRQEMPRFCGRVTTPEKTAAPELQCLTNAQNRRSTIWKCLKL